MVENILATLKSIAKSDPKRIVFPEGDDLRILEACRIISDEGIANPVILQGKRAKELSVENNISLKGLTLLDFEDLDTKVYASKLFDLRKHKGLTLDDAKKLVLDVNYMGVLMVQSGFVDGMVSGASHSTASTLKPALQIIKTKPGVKTASSFFMISKEGTTYFLSDCAFVIDPDAQELCDIAISTASSAKNFGFSPKVALLSFSTKGSADHESLNKIKEALKLIKKANPDLVVDGELQLDSAIVPEVAQMKCPSSPLMGSANVLIFPDLNSGNIGYKLVERLGGFRAVGPIIQGLNKPVNDLSRGCNVDDIVAVTTITVVEVEK